MKPDWDKLAKDFEGSETQLIADVDCTSEGEPLCEEFGIQGFPTIKYGDLADLQEYNGNRDYESLKKFADENLKPQCSPSRMDLCSDEKKAEIQKYMDMDKETLAAAIVEKEAELAKLDEDFEKFVEGLQQQYEAMMEQNQKDKDAVQKAGLGLMRAVRASLHQKMEKDEL